MDFKRKLGHGLSALFSSDDEIDREIERMEKAQASRQEEDPFSKEAEKQHTISNIEEDSADEESPFDQQVSSESQNTVYEPISVVNSNEFGVFSSDSEDHQAPDEQYYGGEPVSPVLSAMQVRENTVLSEKTEADYHESIENKFKSDSRNADSSNQRADVSSLAAAESENREEKDADEEADIDSIDDSMDNGTDPKDHIQLVDIYKIEPDRQQPRKSFDSAQLSELAASIKQYGVLSPLLVSKEEDYYKIIAGERRYRAARMAGLEKLPVIIREFDEQDKMAVALIENIQRQELNPMEEANAYRTLMDKYRMTQEEIAEKLNKSRSSIANLLRLQKLPESVQKSLSEGLISFGHAKVLLGVEDPIDQTRLALQIVSNNLSVRELEDLVRSNHAGEKKKNKSSKGTGKVQTFSHRLAEDRLKDKLSTKVSVNGGKRKGNITIEFYSQDDLERILAILGI